MLSIFSGKRPGVYNSEKIFLPEKLPEISLGKIFLWSLRKRQIRKTTVSTAVL